MTVPVPTRIEVTPPSRHLLAWMSAASTWDTRPPADALGVSPGDDVLVAVAHPDDETLGLGAGLADLTASGVDVHVVAMTSGEHALAHLGRRPDGLGQRRYHEFRAACAALGATTSQVLGFPDGGLAERGPDLEAAVLELLGRHHPDHVLTTWWQDPHPDHVIVGEVTRRAARQRGVPVSGFPVWAMHWSEPVLTRETQLTVLETSTGARSMREAAVACYPSQLLPLEADVQPIVPREVAANHLEIVVSG